MLNSRSHLSASSKTPAIVHPEDLQPNEGINKRKQAAPPLLKTVPLPRRGNSGGWRGRGTHARGFPGKQYAIRGNSSWRGRQSSRGGVFESQQSAFSQASTSAFIAGRGGARYTTNSGSHSGSFNLHEQHQQHHAGPSAWAESLTPWSSHRMTEAFSSAVPSYPRHNYRSRASDNVSTVHDSPDGPASLADAINSISSSPKNLSQKKSFPKRDQDGNFQSHPTSSSSRMFSASTQDAVANALTSNSPSTMEDKPINTDLFNAHDASTPMAIRSSSITSMSPRTVSRSISPSVPFISLPSHNSPPPTPQLKRSSEDNLTVKPKRRKVEHQADSLTHDSLRYSPSSPYFPKDSFNSNSASTTPPTAPATVPLSTQMLSNRSQSNSRSTSAPHVESNPQPFTLSNNFTKHASPLSERSEVEVLDWLVEGDFDKSRRATLLRTPPPVTPESTSEAGQAKLESFSPDINVFSKTISPTNHKLFPSASSETMQQPQLPRRHTFTPTSLPLPYSQPEIRIKAEPSPSPSPATSIARRLVTQSCSFYPMPDDCKKTNPKWEENRKRLFRTNFAVLHSRGFKKKKVFFRDDGMVIEWNSPMPVWSDTLLPEFSDLAAVIDQAYKDSSCSPKKKGNATRRSPNSVVNKKTEVISPSPLGANVKMVEERHAVSSAGGATTQSPSDPTPEPPRITTLVPLPKRSKLLFKPRRPPQIVASDAPVSPTPAQATPHSTSAEKVVPTVLPSELPPAQDDANVPPPLAPKASVKDITTIKATIPRGMEPPLTSNFTPKVMAKGEECDLESGDEDVDDVPDRDMVMDFAYPNPENVDMGDANTEPPIADSDIQQEGFNSENGQSMFERQTSKGTSTNWSAEEAMEAERLAISFLQRFIQAFDSSRDDLVGAYAENAMLSYSIHHLKNQPLSMAALFVPRDSSRSLSRSLGRFSHPTLVQGSKKIMEKLRQLGPYQFCPKGEPANVHYDLLTLPEGMILLKVHAEITSVGKEKNYVISLDQAFVLVHSSEIHVDSQSANEDDLLGGSVKPWPLVAISHQMSARDGLLLPASH